MKVKVKKRIFIGLSALAIAAAVAIPIGIVYGIRSFASSTNTPNEIVINKQDALSEAYEFGTDLKDIKVPELAAEGYNVNPDNYEKGVADTSNITSTTKVGEKAATITFIYNPKKGVSGPTYKITYPLNTVKGKPQSGFGTNNNGLDYEAKEVAYSTNSFAQVEAMLDLQKKYKGYVINTSESAKPNPKYSKAKEDKSDLNEKELAELDAGTTFTGVYKFVFNADQFQDTTPDGTKVISEGTLEVSFKIVPFELAVQNDIEAGATVNLSYGQSFTLPVPGASAQKEHYMKVPAENGIQNPISEILIKPDGSTATPEKGNPIDPTKVMNYEPGTQFTVSYLYKPVSPNYTGKQYKYIYRYTIATAVLTNPNFAPTTTATVAYGTIDANVQQTVPPYSADGFIATVSDAFISKQSGIAPKGASLSPAVDTKVDWANVNKYNSGTKYTVVYKYAPKQHYSYSGAEITVSQEYEIVKRKVTVPAYDFRTANESGYAYGDDPALLVAPTPATGFTTSNAAVFYPSNKQPAATDATITADAVRVINVDSYFVGEWTATLDSDNYEPEQTNGPTSYKIGVPYKVRAQPAVYTGTLTYPAESIEFKSSLPASFSSISTLPEQAKNKGYEYSKTTYEIQTRATDSSSPISGQPAVLTDISKYGAGTVVKAVYTFVPKANYGGNPITATKLLTITKKTVALPAPFTAPAVSVNWGTSQPQPTVAPFSAPEGYKSGEYTGAVFTATGKDGKPANTSQTVDWNQFQNYGAGTVVKVTWTYKPDSANYQAAGGGALADVTATREITILPVKKTKPEMAQIDAQMVRKGVEFGKFDATNPFTPPAFDGYQGKVTGAKVSVASSFSPTSPVSQSPAVGTPVVAPYSDINFYNSDTVITVTYEYTSAPNYDAETFSASQDYKIVPQKVTTYPEKTYYKGAPIPYSRSKNKVEDLYFVSTDPKLYWIKDGSIWYDGPSDANTTIDKFKKDIDLVASQPTGGVYTISYRVWFAPSKDLHNYLGVKPDGSTYDQFVIEKTFVITD